MKERVKSLCKANGISMNKLEETLEFGKGYISKLGSSTPNTTKIKQIADYFGVSVDYLMTGNDVYGVHTCPECGLTYNSSYPEDIEEHNKEHLAWEKATEKFGALYCNGAENERIKAQGRNICQDLSHSLEERYTAQLEVLRCLFSKSVASSGYNLKHVSFNEYVAMMLGNKTYRKNLDDNLYKSLVNAFGVSAGIDSGTVYNIPSESVHSLAAHFDGDEYTESELNEIRQFAEFVKNKRKS